MSTYIPYLLTQDKSFILPDDSVGDEVGLAASSLRVKEEANPMGVTSVVTYTFYRSDFWFTIVEVEHLCRLGCTDSTLTLGLEQMDRKILDTRP